MLETGSERRRGLQKPEGWRWEGQKERKKERRQRLGRGGTRFFASFGLVGLGFLFVFVFCFVFVFLV